MGFGLTMMMGFVLEVQGCREKHNDKTNAKCVISFKRWAWKIKKGQEKERGKNNKTRERYQGSEATQAPTTPPI